MLTAPLHDSELPLEALQYIFASDLHHVDRIIHERLSHRLRLIPEISGHLIFAGGKRLRPLLLLTMARLCSQGELAAAAYPLGAAIEFVHTATLLHDDVVDDSPLRRGQNTAKSIWGNNLSILVGDFLFTQAFRLMVEYGEKNALTILSRCTQQIVEGEIQQIEACLALKTPISEMLQVIEGKTASLFAASCEVGARTAQSSPVQAGACQSFGHHFGMAFQIIDDIQDYLSEQRGKTQGDDFLSGKITLPVLVAYQTGSAHERVFWEEKVLERQATPEDIPQAVAYVRSHLAECLTYAARYAKMAQAALSTFVPSVLKHKLIDLSASYGRVGFDKEGL